MTYYEIIIDNKPKVKIVANNDADAKVIAHEMYPSQSLHVRSINKDYYYGNNN